jgi:hypothetical protein
MIGSFMAERCNNDVGFGKISVSLVDLVSASASVFVFRVVLRRMLKAREETFK